MRANTVHKYALVLRRIMAREVDGATTEDSLSAMFAACKKDVHLLDIIDQEHLYEIIDRMTVLSDDIRNFLKLLRKKHQLGNVLSIIAVATARVKRAAILTRSELSSDALQDISAIVERKLGQQVILEAVVDQSIVGGFIVRGDTFIIDATVENRMHSLSTMMLGIVESL